MSLPMAYAIPDSSECVFIWHDTVTMCDNCSEVEHGCICPHKELEQTTGYFYALGMRGYMYNSEISGPFDSEKEAYAAADDCYELDMPEWGDVQ